VSDTTLYALADGRRVDAGDQELHIDEILAVQPSAAAERRGERFVRTRATMVQIQIGPYAVAGFLHGAVAGDPVSSLPRRKTMVPITEATISYTYAGREVSRSLAVLIINRMHAEEVRRVHHEKSEIDEVPLPPVDPRAKDLTGRLRDVG
jgi:hypothetical protein